MIKTVDNIAQTCKESACCKCWNRDIVDKNNKNKEFKHVASIKSDAQIGNLIYS